MCGEKVTRLHVRLAAKRKENYNCISQNCLKEVDMKNFTFWDVRPSLWITSTCLDSFLIYFCFSVLRPICSASNGQIYSKFDNIDFYENLLINSKLGWNRTKISGISHEDMSSVFCADSNNKSKILEGRNRCHSMKKVSNCIISTPTRIATQRKITLVFAWKQFLREAPEFHIILKQPVLFYLRLKDFLFDANKGKGKR
jgi:hypothetical protein